VALLDRDGVNIYYETHGQGPAILLTHGYAATSQMWRGQVEALAKDHTLILWDMRGHGQSDSPDDDAAYSESSTTADMAALLDLHGFDSAVIGGLSLGGYMSLAFHADYPARVKALLVIDTGPGYKRAEPRAAWNRRANARAEAIEKHGLAALAGGSPERSRSVHKDPQGLVRAARNMLTQYNARVIESLPSIAVPTIVVVGEQDEPFLAATDYMATKIPGARKVMVPNAGHAVNIDQPAVFNAAIVDFLNDNGL